MHDTALAIGAKFLELYCSDPSKTVVELGSQDVNGSLRDHCAGATYFGLDFEHGKGVDFVIQPNQPLPIRSCFADIVVSSSQMEHDTFFWKSFLEMVRILKPGGYLYINAPSNGIYHTFPSDVWRFYPDAGKALAKWARENDYDVVLVESFTAERQADMWNDFVAVFRVGPDDKPARPLLSDLFPCTNVWLINQTAIGKKRVESEDMIIADRLRAEADELRGRIAVATEELAKQAARISHLEAELIEAKTAQRFGRTEWPSDAEQIGSA